MRDLHERRIVLGVSGSIAAYKAVYLLRLLTQAGAHVTPVLTRGAQRFVGALSFSSLAGRRAITDLWSAAESGEVGHVETAHWAELVIVAPASADTLGRIALGRADDPLSAIALSSRAPLLLAPAMEENMWSSEATRGHVDALRARGARLVLPEAGALASGREGSGRLAPPEHVVAAATAALTEQRLSGRQVVVTAGPTREHWDPVRFLSNPSSGRMGFALAEEAALRGARVTLVSGPVELPTPWGVERVDVTDTEEMLAAVKRALEPAHALIMAAAPADLRPSTRAEHKQKKERAPSALPLSRTPDILATLTPRKAGKLVVGFAAETENLDEHARAKLEHKDLDAVVGNLVSSAGVGFAAETNEGTLFVRNGDDLHLAMGSKREMAAKIVDWVASRLSS